MDLLQNPFYILNASLDDNRRRIMELADECSLLFDLNECMKACSELTNPRKRLSAEVAWLPGFGCWPARDIWSPNSLVTPTDLVFLTHVPLIAKANLLAASLARLSVHSADEIVEWILEIAWAFEDLAPDELSVIINEERIFSGFPEVSDLSAVATEIQERRRHYLRVIKSALDNLPQKELVKAVTVIVESATADGEKQVPILIADLVDSYEIKLKEHLRKGERNIRTFVENLRADVNAKMPDFTLAFMVDHLIDIVRYWDTVAQPIQVSTKSQGLEHDASHRVAYLVRDLAIDMFNKHDKLYFSQQLTNMLRLIFAEVVKVAELTAEDADALDEIEEQRIFPDDEIADLRILDSSEVLIKELTTQIEADVDGGRPDTYLSPKVNQLCKLLMSWEIDPDHNLAANPQLYSRLLMSLEIDPDHNASTDVYRLVYMFNKHDKFNFSKQLKNILQEVFEVPKIKELTTQIKADVDVGRPDIYLSPKVNQLCQLVMSYMSWNADSKYDASQHVACLVRNLAIHMFHEHGKLDFAYQLIKAIEEYLADLFLALSALTLRSSTCKYSNADAARWAVDVLSNLSELVANVHLGHQWHLAPYELITPSTLQPGSDCALLKSIPYVEATVIALRNYWTDIRCLTAAYLLGASQYKTKNEQKDLIDALIHGSRLDPSVDVWGDYSSLTSAETSAEDILDVYLDNDAIYYRPSLTSAEDILDVYLRQNGCWDGQSEYKSLLGKHLEQLDRIEESELISGRIYSFCGTKREIFLPKFFKVIGIGLTNSKFAIDQKWLSFLKSDAISKANLEYTISALRKLVSIDDSVISAVTKYFDLKLEKAKEKSELFVSSIEEIIDDLKSKISKSIINAPIDQDRLVQLGVASSGSTFTLSDGPMPVPLFDVVEYYKDDFSADVFVTNIPGYPKSQVSQGVEVDRLIGEERWLNNIISREMETACFQQLLEQSHWKEVEFEDAKNLILRAVEDSQYLKSKDLAPIMFVGLGDVYELINSSRWQYVQDDEKLPVDVESNKPEGYICHLAGIEVYRLPFSKLNFSILLYKEVFKKINVKRFGDGRYVDVTFKPKSNNDLTGTLSLAFGVECEFGTADCFRYISLNPDK